MPKGTGRKQCGVKELEDLARSLKDASDGIMEVTVSMKREEIPSIPAWVRGIMDGIAASKTATRHMKFAVEREMDERARQKIESQMQKNTRRKVG